MNMTIEVAPTGILAAYFTVVDGITGHRRTIELDTCFVDYDTSGHVLVGVEIIGQQDPVTLTADLFKVGLEQHIISLIIDTIPNAWMKSGKV